MTTTLHDLEVAARFDEVAGRFKADVPADDCRLLAVLSALDGLECPRILDLGCGKGRFAKHLARRGARVTGVDISSKMIEAAPEQLDRGYPNNAPPPYPPPQGGREPYEPSPLVGEGRVGGGIGSLGNGFQQLGIDRVLANARRLPFGAATFDAVVAVEVLEHIGRVREALDEIGRVLRPGGRLVIVDKNVLALDARRPWLPSVVVKWIDQRRGLWMYGPGDAARERWFRPSRMASRLRESFVDVRIEHLLSTQESRRAVFRAVPGARLLTCWSATAPEADRS